MKAPLSTLDAHQEARRRAVIEAVRRSAKKAQRERLGRLPFRRTA